MRVLAYITIFLTFVSFIEKQDYYFLINAKEFQVEGTTSIGEFSCSYDLHSKDTLFLNNKSELSYKIPVREFGCGNFFLNRDFRKTLKEREYSEVIITISDLKQREGNYFYTLVLSLAGCKKTFKDLTMVREGKNLRGTMQLKFSDFDLVAPKKFGGTIRIKDEVKLSILLKT